MKTFSLLASIAVLLALGQQILASTNTTSNETIWVRSHLPPSHLTSHVQSIYDNLGGTFALPSYFGPGAHISGLILSNSTDDLPLAAYRQSGNSSLSIGNSPLSLDKRAAIKPISVTCTDPPEFANRLVSFNAQVFMNGVFCDWVVALTPYSVAVVGLVFSNLQCGNNNQYLCQGLWTVGAVKAGDTIGTGIQNLCAEGMESLANACFQTGGSQVVEVTATGVDFQMEGYANSATEETCAGTTSGDLCSSYTCTGQCNPGHDDPV
ncbi:hypothetical protein IFM47457_08610 [Aspergillus lentulus]|nr:hypothetical protein IFM47457_08610 [Aspergillus lentulus]